MGESMVRAKLLLLAECVIAGFLLAAGIQSRWDVGQGTYWLVFVVTCVAFWRLYLLSPRFGFAVTVVATTVISLLVYLVGSSFFGDAVGLLIAAGAAVISIGLHRLDRPLPEPPIGRDSLHDTFAEAKRRADELVGRE